MICDIRISEKSFGAKTLFSNVNFSIDDDEKVALIGRNGIGKSTLLHILSGKDSDYDGEVIFRRGVSVVSTLQEHFNDDQTVIDYVLEGLPEHKELANIIRNYPSIMNDDLKLIDKYTKALERFTNLGYFTVEDKIREEFKNFQIPGLEDRKLASLSGGQKRIVEIIKVMHSNTHLALFDEPTNHMDYVAKRDFIEFIKNKKQAMLIVSHDRDVLKVVDKIVEIKDGKSKIYNGNYDFYLKQNSSTTANEMNDYENVKRRIANLKIKHTEYKRLKEKSRNPSTIHRFKMLEQKAFKELNELLKIEKPSFWIDENSLKEVNYKTADQYSKYKTKNIRLNIKNDDSKSKRDVLKVDKVSFGYKDNILKENLSFSLEEHGRLELRGRNGRGKSTIIKALLKNTDSDFVLYEGSFWIDPTINVGVYHQEIEKDYLDLPLYQAIEKCYLDLNLSISDQKIRKLLNDYLFSLEDHNTLLRKLSGGQKSRFQLIQMLANDPKLLILDEPTNHLDLPSIEELENALNKFSGAILFVSHDGYFIKKLKAKVVEI